MKSQASPKASSAKKKAPSKAAAAPSKAPAKTPAKVQTKAKAQAEAKPSWAETMKKALEKKQPAGGFPNQPKPRDSGVPKVKKNAF